MPLMRAAFVAVLPALLVSTAGAQSSFDLGDRRHEVIDDPVRIEFAIGGAAETMQRITDAVDFVARQKDWEVEPKGAGRWQLTHEARGRHMAKVDLLCDTASCTFHYVDSRHLNYGERAQSGSPLRAIHKTYNAWLRELASALGSALGGKSARIIVGFAPLGDAEALPHVNTRARQAYREWLKRPKPRAFAIALNGAWGWSAPIEGTYLATRYLDSIGNAMKRCNQSGGDICKLYAVDDRVVWDPAR